jgi:glycyl-tRNA synthetase beta chain
MGQNKAVEALGFLASLHDDITAFFDAVMVMAEDEKVRNNRLALLALIHKDLSTFADFSKLVFA